uniref:MAM domain-containing protein n=1 Tax=Myripristis murdjan TaxID=586833 RepID=A0A667Y0Y2_9TELE
MSNLKWVRTSQEKITLTNPLQGPGRDHSTNSASGHFLYVTVPVEGLKMDWAAFQSPLLEPTNSSHPCKMVMYTHQFGPRSGGLTVLVADRAIYPVWQRGGALGDLWVKAEVEIVTNSSFYIVIMAAIRDAAYGGIAVDSITLSPECRNYSLAEFPQPPEHPCTDADKMCNFHVDCEGGKDEAKCGDFSYPQGSSGWTDASVGSQGWVLNKMTNSTTKDESLYIAEAPGQQLTEAQTRTPLLGPSGPACTLKFSFALTGNPPHIGELSVGIIDTVMGKESRLWEFAGKTGKEEGTWREAEVPIGARKNRFQLEFEARARKLCPCAKIQVSNVRFVDCHAEYFPSSPTGDWLSCNFEAGLCGWYQDKSDGFDWTELSGMDHSTGIGKSLAVDMWSLLRGASGRLLSYTQLPTSTEQCLSFYYKLYGPDTGTLNVKLIDSHGVESLLWTRRGAHGNVWHQGLCPVSSQLTSFQLVFEAVHSGFDGRVAIDDVAFIPRQCTVPRMCSFEGQRCGYTSYGTTRWLHKDGLSTTAGPKSDHTLETESGYYMMAHTDAEILPVDKTTTLASPIRLGVARTECLSFWYHMGGMNPGSLTVYMKPVKGERVEIFSDNLNQGNVWRHGNGNITSTLVDWQLEFEVTGAGGKGTHVAVDDIAIFAHPCQNQGSKCNFERGTCGWSNTQNPQTDKLDWELTSREAETHYTTPPHDHSLATERGHFLLFPSTDRTPANQNAWLLSAHLPPTQGTCLKFWAHRPSSADNQLKVWRLAAGKLHELLLVDEVRGIWKRFDINITSSEDYQIVLEGVKGTAGILALDDIEYTIGVNCAGEKGDDAGGIAASVIVVLLLVGTLIALLVYYLRTRDRVKASTNRLPSSSPSASSSSAGPGFSNDSYEPGLTVSKPASVTFGSARKSESALICDL